MKPHHQISTNHNLEKTETSDLSNDQPPIVTPSLFSSEIKKYIIYISVGGIIVSALISIGAILAGEFNDITGKALLSTASIVIHSLLALAFVGARMIDKNQYTIFIINILFILLLISLPTSLLSTWGAFTYDQTLKIYGVYSLVFFASIYCLIIIRTQLLDNIAKMTGNVSMAIAVILAIYLIPLVVADDTSSMDEFYYRVLAVLAILLGTSTVLSAIFHKLFLSRHPELKTKSTRKTPVWAITLIIILGLLLSPFLIFFILIFLPRDY